MLVEFNTNCQSHVSYAYLSNGLASLFSANQAAFVASKTKMRLLPRWADRLVRQLLWVVQDDARTYRSFGCRDFFYPAVSLAQKKIARVAVRQFLARKPSKKDLENLKIGDVLLGDLVYDNYLRSRNLPTPDLSSADFKNFLLSSVADLVFWTDQMSKGQIKAVIASHSVYNLAIPLRVALQQGIPAFQATARSIYRLSSERQFAEDGFIDFRNEYSSLSMVARTRGLEEARSRIARRFRGESGVDVNVSSALAYSPPKKNLLLSGNSKIKLLVAAHCFSDSPHWSGNHLFTDYWEWLDFLGDFAKKTDFEWYLKPHPDCLSSNAKHLRMLAQRYPAFVVLPADASHLQIIKEGVTAALTVHGTIGFEYAALGVPVINASLNNPHIAYSFNHHPASVKEYEQAILNVSSLPAPGQDELREVEEFYFMQHIYRDRNLFFDDFDLISHELDGSQGPKNPQMYYSAFLKNRDALKHQNLVDQVQLYVSSETRKLESTPYRR